LRKRTCGELREVFAVDITPDSESDGELFADSPESAVSLTADCAFSSYQKSDPVDWNYRTVVTIGRN